MLLRLSVSGISQSAAGTVAMGVSFADREVRLLGAVDAIFADFDSMAASPLAWDQRYEHIGRGKFQGRMMQVALSTIQVGRVRWKPGILQRGSAPSGSLVVGFPITANGSLHLQGRQVAPGQPLLVGPSQDIAFVANGDTDLPIVAIPNHDVERWMQVRRGTPGLDRQYLNRPWALRPDEMLRRGTRLGELVRLMLENAHAANWASVVSGIEAEIFELVLGTVPSTEVVEPLHRRARTALRLRDLLLDHREAPISITAMCELLGVTDRTLFLSCFEAFGRGPKRLLLELRLNAVRRTLSRPDEGCRVTDVALKFGFLHFGRFSELYKRQFDELPSRTLRSALGA
jgi:AraC family transcriptional regulator, ethanolamine operon transcriptional activator